MPGHVLQDGAYKPSQLPHAGNPLQESVMSARVKLPSAAVGHKPLMLRGKKPLLKRLTVYCGHTDLLLYLLL